jgi:hypothetical protein
MPSITVIIVSLLVALTPLAGRHSGNTGATSRPVVAPVHAFDVVGGSPTVH